MNDAKKWAINEHPAEIRLDSWAGRHYEPVKIVGCTPTRWRVVLMADAWLPGNRRPKAGEVVLVPRYAVREK